MAQDIFANTPDVDLRKRWALMQLQNASSGTPTTGLGAIARALQGAIGGYAGYQASQDDDAALGVRMNAPGLGSAPPAPAAPSAPPSSPAPSVPQGQPMAGNLPRGIRNNNPLNIEAGQFTSGLPGYAGSDGRFARFDSPEGGLAAANKLLDVYQNKHGLNTVSGIINRWAPPSDGNNVSAYAGNVSKQLGIDPNAPIPPEMRQQLIAAMGRHENGRPIQMAALGGGMPAAPQAAPAGPQMAQAPQQRAPSPIPPEMQTYIQQLYATKNKANVAKADALYQQFMKPVEPKFNKLDDETLYDERTGATKPAGPGFKSLTDPGERARFGIPAEDKRPYQSRGGKLINPPAETRINIDQTTERAFDTASAKHQAERFDKLVQGGFEAKGMRADVGALRDIGSRITTGKTAEITNALGPYAEALGVKIDGLGDLQAYQAIVSKMAPRMRVAGSGATSDFEMRKYLEAIPGLGKTAEGNAIIESTMEALQNHHETAADIASRAMNKEITPREADKLLRELPDPLTAWKKSKGVSKLGEGAPTVDDLIKKYAK